MVLAHALKALRYVFAIIHFNLQILKSAVLRFSRNTHSMRPMPSQNLSRSEVSRLRIGLGASDKPNCVLFTVVFHPVNTG